MSFWFNNDATSISHKQHFQIHSRSLHFIELLAHKRSNFNTYMHDIQRCTQFSRGGILLKKNGQLNVLRLKYIANLPDVTCYCRFRNKSPGFPFGFYDFLTQNKSVTFICQVVKQNKLLNIASNEITSLWWKKYRWIFLVVFFWWFFVCFFFVFALNK